MGKTSVSEPRRKKFLSLKDRLALYANEVRERASLLPPGNERDTLLRKADQADILSDIDDWSRSSASREPKKNDPVDRQPLPAKRCAGLPNDTARAPPKPRAVFE